MFCFSTFSIPGGPAFTFRDFDRVGGLGFAFDVGFKLQLQTNVGNERLQT